MNGPLRGERGGHSGEVELLTHVRLRFDAVVGRVRGDAGELRHAGVWR
jgi:hypothetical protein